MQVVDRIEKRRFIGREFLLWLWFESEVFDSTLIVAAGEDVSLWPVESVVFSSGKEVTQIKGESPTATREAKEAVLRGKSAEKFGIRIEVREREYTLHMKGDSLAIAGLKLPALLGDEDEDGTEALAAMGPAKGPKRGKKTSVEEDAEREADMRAESFYERMMDTREIEAVLGALYRTFLRLRLSSAWATDVVPSMQAWLLDQEFVLGHYHRARTAVLGRKVTPTKPAK
jgi:hypothetical protein